MPWWDGFDEGDLGAPLPPGPYPREYDLPGREPGITPYTPPEPELIPPGELPGLDNPLFPTPPGEPGPPEQPNVPGPPVLFPPGPPVVFEPGPPPIAGVPPPPPTPRPPRGVRVRSLPRDWQTRWPARNDDERDWFVARPRPPRTPRIEERPFTWPRTLPPRRPPTRPRRARIEDQLRDWELIPWPLPSERNPNPPSLPPRTLPVPTPRPQDAPIPNEVSEVPGPYIPGPAAPMPEVRVPIPREPPAPVMTPPRAPPVPRRARPRVARWPRVAGPAASAASILRRYIVRQPEPAQPRFELRDFFPEVAPQPIAPPSTPQVAPPAQLPEVPDPFADLTPFNAAALPFAQPATRTSPKECKCEDETEEEAEERRERNASSIIADVKTYRRRMSQNSLDNLR